MRRNSVGIPVVHGGVEVKGALISTHIWSRPPGGLRIFGRAPLTKAGPRAASAAAVCRSTHIWSRCHGSLRIFVRDLRIFGRGLAPVVPWHPMKKQGVPGFTHIWSRPPENLRIFTRALRIFGRGLHAYLVAFLRISGRASLLVYQPENRDKKGSRVFYAYLVAPYIKIIN